MSEIYDYPLSFNLVKKYIVFTFKHFFSEYIVVGKENIPSEGPMIFAPNHTNALMDAFAVHSIAPKNLPIIFLARADIFKNKYIAKFLRSAKIMPAFRMRDGMENLGKNNDVFDKCIEILSQNKALGIMPEGNQEIERKLRPLVKGIFRIAFASQEKKDTQTGVKIIPVGIDYGDILKSNNHIIISIGKPIEVSEYMKSYADNPVVATNEIRDRLRTDMENLTINLATESYYDCFELVTKIANKSVLDELKLKDKTIFRFVARQKIAERLVSLEKNDPDKIKKLNLLGTEYTTLLKKLNLKTWVFDKPIFSNSFLNFEGLILFWTFPFFIYGFIVNFLPFFIPVFIRKFILKAKFPGFFSSLQLALGLITFPLFYILQTVLISSLLDFSWWAIILFFCLQYPFGKWAIKWYKMAKRYQAMMRFRALNNKKSSELLNAQNLREQIIRMII